MLQTPSTERNIATRFFLYGIQYERYLEELGSDYTGYVSPS
jgi:hypothetical protein